MNNSSTMRAYYERFFTTGESIGSTTNERLSFTNNMPTICTPQELHIRWNNDEIKQTSNAKATSQRHLNVPSVVECRMNRPSNNNDLETNSYE